MRASDGVEVLSLTANLAGGPGAIHPVLLWDQETAILVDTGFPGQEPKFIQAMEGLGIPYENLGRIFITHHDIDHVGSLAALVKSSPRPIEVISHREEKPYIQGDLPSVKMTPERLEQLAEQMKSLPEPTRQALQSVFGNLSQFWTPVTRMVEDGEVLPYCGGITVVHTPGHTPGHSCLYLQQSRTLIAGDALFIEDGALVPAPAHLNHNNAQEVQSLGRLSQLDIETVICYHGGIFRDHPNRRIAELARSQDCPLPPSPLKV